MAEKDKYIMPMCKYLYDITQDYQWMTPLTGFPKAISLSLPFNKRTQLKITMLVHTGSYSSKDRSNHAISITRTSSRLLR